MENGGKKRGECERELAEQAFLDRAMVEDAEQFRERYRWLERAMPTSFFTELSIQERMLVAQHLIHFRLQDYHSTIHMKKSVIVLLLDAPDADIRVLENYTLYGIKHYKTYISKEDFPLDEGRAKLRIATIHFSEAIDSTEGSYDERALKAILPLLKEKNPEYSDGELGELLGQIHERFLGALSTKQLVLVFDMFLRARTRDNCQYEVLYNEDWKESGAASMEIVLAWRNTPKYNFLYRMAKVVHRYDLVMKSVNAAYVEPHSRRSVTLMVLGVHGKDQRAAWDAADIVDFLRELVTLKYFDEEDLIDSELVAKSVVSGGMGYFLRAAVDFVHQALVHIDSEIYRVALIEEALCRHPELTQQLCELFLLKFHPDRCDIAKYESKRTIFLELVDKLDTGQEKNDTRRRHVLRIAQSFIHFCLKTNYFRRNYTAISFRLDPRYLDEIPFDRKKFFPELPFGIFFIRGMHFFAFHIRFRDLARGGLRTVYFPQMERTMAERDSVFRECYYLAYTQQKKNKDIPEGGSKAVIFIMPFSKLDSESAIYRRELSFSGVPETMIVEKIAHFREEQIDLYLHYTQRAFVESLLTLINGDERGVVKAKYIIDYWRQPEFVYLGPDERMSKEMIEWIAEFSKKYDYKPGGAFISSKPRTGINHKEYGVTSLGVNVYMHRFLNYLGINPKIDSFTIKMSGGPDGDVAGNQILNLHRYYPNTAKLIALTDISGTIFDPQGVDLEEMVRLFREGRPIRFYAPDKLHEGGFLLDRERKRDESKFVQQTLCWRKEKGETSQHWLSGSEMNYLFRTNVHRVKSDVFIPAGGRPRTLNLDNYGEFLSEDGQPTARLVVEGANLYLTERARDALEERSLLIIKDSTANKGGVICSSFEVLSGLTLTEEEFLLHKEQIVCQILDRIRYCSLHEADLLLKEMERSKRALTKISDEISERINLYTDQLASYLKNVTLSDDLDDPLIRCYFSYCLPLFTERFSDRLIKRVPDGHKKAIIAAQIASQIVYKKGLGWSPSIVDILPILWRDEELITSVPIIASELF